MGIKDRKRFGFVKEKLMEFCLGKREFPEFEEDEFMLWWAE